MKWFYLFASLVLVVICAGDSPANINVHIGARPGSDSFTQYFPIKNYTELFITTRTYVYMQLSNGIPGEYDSCYFISLHSGDSEIQKAEDDTVESLDTYDGPLEFSQTGYWISYQALGKDAVQLKVGVIGNDTPILSCVDATRPIFLYKPYIGLLTFNSSYEFEPRYLSVYEY